MRLTMWWEGWQWLGRLLTRVLDPPGSAASALLRCQVDLLLCPVRIASKAVGLGREMDPWHADRVPGLPG